jgi:hypothetical protein
MRKGYINIVSFSQNKRPQKKLLWAKSIGAENKSMVFNLK